MNHAFLRAPFALIALSAALLPLAATANAAALPRDHIVLRSAISVDPQRNTVVLPLHKGRAHGKTVYYILTDSSNKVQAASLGLDYAPAIGEAYTQRGVGNPSALTFAGAPNFAPVRVYKSSATGFPPKQAMPGAVADGAYSPFVTLPGGTTLDAPIVATGNGPFDVTTHTNTADRVLAIDPVKKTVTILLTQGFFNGARVAYLSTDASDPSVAAIERATYTKNLALSKAASKEPIVTLANGQTGAKNPQAQGLAHLALDERLSHEASLVESASFGSPLNVLATFAAGPAASAYTPLWEAYVGVWAKGAVAQHRNVRVTSIGQAFALSARGTISSPDGKPLHSAGFVVNCPVVACIDPLK